MIKKLLTPTLFSVVIIFFLIINPTLAQGDLMIMPKRIVFDNSQGSQEVNLANTGNDTAVYAISFNNYKMTEKTGNFEQLEEPEEGQRFATDFLRYFPRRVTLAPNEAQTVRVQLTKTGNLENGEYRSHMYFRAVEEETALGEESTDETKGIAINITTVFGISIPVIVRHGESTTNVSLTNVHLDKTGEKPKINMVINRSGNMSVYGNIKVIHIAPNGTTREVGQVKGLSVYTPNIKRNFSIEMGNVEEDSLNGGKLMISYIEEKGKVLANSELILE